MARNVDVAAIHFNMSDLVGHTALRAQAMAQFQAASARLDGTGVGLVVTCEGMSMVVQTLEEAESVTKYGPLMEMYATFARRNACTVVGSTKLAERGKIYNAQVMFGPQGDVLGVYCKTFLVDVESAEGLTRGSGAVVVDTPAGRIGGVICFDLNYEELRLSYRNLRPDIMAFSSMFHGGHMQSTWAYETRAFFAGACKDGSSQIRDPLGRVLATASYYSVMARARINLDRVIVHLDKNQDRFPDMLRAYGKKVRIECDSDMGLALITCDGDDCSIEEMIRTFGLVPLDPYLDGSRKA